MKKGIHRPILLCCAALPWMAMLGFCRHDDPATWSELQWVTWRNLQIDRILAPTTDELGQRVLNRQDIINRSEEAFQFVQPLLDNSKFFAQHKEIGNFVKFVKAQHWMALKGADGVGSNELGMDISDKDYWAYAAPKVALPDLLTNQGFLQLMTQPGTYSIAEQMIEAHNKNLPEDQKWIVYLFRGQFIPSVDRTTYGRMLVVVPNIELPDGRLWDRWISFAIATPGVESTTVSKSVSVIATVRDPAKPGQSDAYFVDYLREKDPETRDISYQPTFLRKPNPSKNCYNCHKSAVLPIRPKAAYAFDEGGTMVEATASQKSVQDRLDRIIDQYGKTNLGHLDPDSYGPSLGPLIGRRTDEFISSATKGAPISVSSYPAVAATMNCARCHDEVGRLNYLIGVRSDADTKSFESKQGILQTFVEQGYMPPGNTLSQAERHALWECLSKEYFDPDTGKGQFVDWLKGK